MVITFVCILFFRKKKLDEQTPMNESAESRGLLQGDLHKNPFKKKVKPIKPPKHFRQKQPSEFTDEY